MKSFLANQEDKTCAPHSNCLPKPSIPTLQPPSSSRKSVTAHLFRGEKPAPTHNLYSQMGVRTCTSSPTSRIEVFQAQHLAELIIWSKCIEVYKIGCQKALRACEDDWREGYEEGIDYPGWSVPMSEQLMHSKHVNNHLQYFNDFSNWESSFLIHFTSQTALPTIQSLLAICWDIN